MSIVPDGGLELVAAMDIVVMPGWHKLDEPPTDNLLKALVQAYQRGAAA